MVNQSLESGRGGIGQSEKGESRVRQRVREMT